jgi:hypothetical protein
MYSPSPAIALVVSDLLDMARPGIFERVHIPLGGAEITNSMPLLRCLSSLDDAQTPADVPDYLMPQWAVWLCCSIGDNLSEADYLDFTRAIANTLSGLAEHDEVWDRLKVGFVRKLVRMASALVAPLAAKAPDLVQVSRMASGAADYASRCQSRALDVLLTRLKVERAVLDDETIIDEMVFPSGAGSRGDIRSMVDAVYLPYRLAVWGAQLLAGQEKVAKRMALDFDWTAFLLIAGAGVGGGTAYAGLDWAAMGRWFIDAIAEGVQDDGAILL